MRSWAQAAVRALLILVALSAQSRAEMKGQYAQDLGKLPFDKPFSIKNPSHDSSILCLSTASDPNLIGLFHEIRIKVPVKTLIAVFEDYEHYPEIFESLRKAKVTKKEASTVWIDFESAVPFFLAPNSKYSMIYRTLAVFAELKSSAYKVYSFTLDQSKDLKSLDGVSIIKQIDSDTSLYQEVDFLDANWGAAKFFAPGAIWKDSVEELVRTDLAMKIRAEEPELPSKKLIKKANAELKEEDVKHCIQNKISAQDFFASILPQNITLKKAAP
ncbi:MAG: hypothetical protein H7333_03965 [Bdellovibrionales bacterium]|nr:hypothetical protein [Oligoflexia bacterium]